MDVELARTGTHIFAEHLRHSCHVIGLAHHGEVVGELLLLLFYMGEAEAQRGYVALSHTAGLDIVLTFSPLSVPSLLPCPLAFVELWPSRRACLLK